jgi:hypothetical protein
MTSDARQNVQAQVVPSEKKTGWLEREVESIVQRYGSKAWGRLARAERRKFYREQLTKWSKAAFISAENKRIYVKPFVRMKIHVNEMERKIATTRDILLFALLLSVIGYLMFTTFIGSLLPLDTAQAAVPRILKWVLPLFEAAIPPRVLSEFPFLRNLQIYIGTFFAIYLTVLCYILSILVISFIAPIFFVKRRFILQSTLLIATVLNIALMFAFRSPYAVSLTGEVTYVSILRFAPVAVFFVEAMVIIDLVLLSVSIDTIRKRSEARRPDAHIVHYLFEALWRLQRGDSAWTALDARVGAMNDIGHAAEVAGRALLAKFQEADREYGGWRKVQASKISAALSEKQTWLMTPKRDTRDELYRVLGAAIATIISGYWDNLNMIAEVPSEKKESVPRTILDYSVQFAQLLLIAALPAIIFSMVDAEGLFSDIDARTRGYVRIALVAWAALTLLFRLDPVFKEKISALKEAAQLLKGGSGKDKD